MTVSLVPPMTSPKLSARKRASSITKSRNIDQGDINDNAFTHFPPLEAANHTLSPKLSESDEWNDISQDFMEYALSVLSDTSDDGSSLDSWGEDAFDRDAARRVSAMFADIDACLYDDVTLTNKQLQSECDDWKRKFPHLRVVGKGYSVTPRRSPIPERPPSVLLSSRTAKEMKDELNSKSNPSNSKSKTRKKGKFKDTAKHSERCSKNSITSKNEELIACHHSNDDSDSEKLETHDVLVYDVVDRLIFSIMDDIDNKDSMITVLDKQRHPSSQSDTISKNILNSGINADKRHSEPNIRADKTIIGNLAHFARAKKLEFAVDDSYAGKETRTTKGTQGNARRIISAPNKFGRLKPLANGNRLSKTTTKLHKSRRVEFSATSRLPPISTSAGTTRTSRASTRASTAKTLRSVSSYSLESKSKPTPRKRWVSTTFDQTLQKDKENSNLDNTEEITSRIEAMSMDDLKNGHHRGGTRFKAPSKRIQSQTISSAARQRTPQIIKHTQVHHTSTNYKPSPFRV